MQVDLVFPMFALVLLSGITVVRLFINRLKAVSSGTTSAAYFKTYSGESQESRQGQQLSRNFINQFEAPVLFYVVCLTVMITQQTSRSFVFMAWAYAVVRVVHSIVHTTSNQIVPRLASYMLSWVVLVAMWIQLAWACFSK